MYFSFALPVFKGCNAMVVLLSVASVDSMNCRMCMSPRHSGNDIFWYIMVGKELQPTNITGEELNLNNLSIEQQGMYACKFVDLVRKIYWLHVLYMPYEPIQQVSKA